MIEYNVVGVDFLCLGLFGFGVMCVIVFGIVKSCLLVILYLFCWLVMENKMIWVDVTDLMSIGVVLSLEL